MILSKSGPVIMDRTIFNNCSILNKYIATLQHITLYYFEVTDYNKKHVFRL